MTKITRSAVDGQTVSAEEAEDNPNTTVTEEVGPETDNDQVVNRSAESGRFVSEDEAESNPDETIEQRV